MDLNFKRRASERQIAAEVAIELHQAMRPILDAAGPGADGARLMEENRELLADVFGRVCEKHQLGEAAATRVFGYVPKEIRRLVSCARDLAQATRVPPDLKR